MNKTNHRQRFESTIHILADDRERYSKVIDTLEQMTTVKLEIRRLPLGDYLAANDLLVERKTVRDFAVSVFDGRLFRQAYRLATSEHRTCFIVEGVSNDIGRCGLSNHAFQGAIITVNLIYDQPVLWSGSSDETAWLILTAARQLKRREARRPSRLAQRARTPNQIQSHMLEAIPGVGPDKAAKILESHNSIRAVADLTYDDLLEVPSIGPATAQKITWAFREP